MAFPGMAVLKFWQTSSLTVQQDRHCFTTLLFSNSFAYIYSHMCIHVVCHFVLYPAYISFCCFRALPGVYD